MEVIYLSLMTTLLACSSNQKEEEKEKLGKDCLQIIKDTKIKAPKNISYWGVYSNVGENVTPSSSGYTIRIVKTGKLCQALVLDYLKQSTPHVWSFSEEYNCQLNQIVLDAYLGFKNPYENDLPISRKFSFKGKITDELLFFNLFIYKG